MSVFYDAVKKMRKDGKSLVKSEPVVKIEKPKETAVKKDDKSTGGKS